MSTDNNIWRSSDQLDLYVSWLELEFGTRIKNYEALLVTRDEKKGSVIMVLNVILIIIN